MSLCVTSQHCQRFILHWSISACAIVCMLLSGFYFRQGTYVISSAYLSVCCFLVRFLNKLQMDLAEIFRDS